MFEDALLFIKTQFYKLFPSLLEDDSDQKEYEQQLIKEVEDYLKNNSLEGHISLSKRL